MDLSLFEAPLPQVDEAGAATIAAELYGLTATATPLGGERDRNFRLHTDRGELALKVGNAADHPAAVEMQLLAMEHAHAVDPGLPIPTVIRTKTGEITGHITSPQGLHPTQLVTFLPGDPASQLSSGPGFRRSVGAAVARLSRALRGFRHPATTRDLVWDVTRILELDHLTHHVDAGRRGLVESELERFASQVAPHLDRLPVQPIHGDAHAANVLVDPDDPERLIGIVDFGDITIGPRVLEAAIAAAYQTLGADPVAAMCQVVSAYHLVDPLEPYEIELVPDLAAARLTQSYLVSAWRAEVDPANIEYILLDQEAVGAGLDAMAGVDRAKAVTEIAAACGVRRGSGRTMEQAIALRKDRLGPALSLTYHRPVMLDRGEGVWLIDTDGNRLLDAYNNVPQVGHSHPEVAAAVRHQVTRLATNTRYLVDEVTEYADRLVSLLPDPLSVVMFVNSGSEANDVAYQIARSLTGNRGVIITEHAYHGTTAATASMSPEELGLSKLEGWSTHIGGGATLRRADAGTLVAEELERAFADLAGRNERPAMLILDGVFSSDGIFKIPTGYLQNAYRKMREVGGLVVADEVQAGFGRVGPEFWGFAQDGVIPDIVTLGKPMGNGHPMGAVVTTSEIAAEFASNWHFFSTFAGSPVAAAAGMAVLDVIEREDLARNAREVGAYLRDELTGIGGDHVVAVRGPGLFIGVEMTSPGLARHVTETMRRDGVLVGLTGPRFDVLKIRPPLVFTRHHADRLLRSFDKALADQPSSSFL